MQQGRSCWAFAPQSFLMEYFASSESHAQYRLFSTTATERKTTVVDWLQVRAPEWSEYSWMTVCPRQTDDIWRGFGAGGGSQPCESSFGEMKAASGRVKLWFRTVLWVFLCVRGDSFPGKPTGRNGALGFARRITFCGSLSHTLHSTLSNVNEGNCALVILLRHTSHTLATISGEPHSELDILCQMTRWPWFYFACRRCNCSVTQLCRRLLRLYSGATGGDWARFIFRFPPAADSDVAIWAFAQHLRKHCFSSSQMCVQVSALSNKSVIAAFFTWRSLTLSGF